MKLHTSRGHDVSLADLGLVDLTYQETNLYFLSMTRRAFCLRLGGGTWPRETVQGFPMRQILKALEVHFWYSEKCF